MGTQTAVRPRSTTHFITARDLHPDEVGDGCYHVGDVLKQQKNSLKHMNSLFFSSSFLLSPCFLTSAAAGFSVMAMETRPGPFCGVPNGVPKNMDEGSVLISLSFVSEPKERGWKSVKKLHKRWLCLCYM